MKPRLFVDHALIKSEPLELTGSQLHYLRHVLRLSQGSEVLLFNGQDGEWEAILQQYTKHAGILVSREKIREQTQEKELILICVLIKPNRLELLIEKATELGVTKIIPVVSDYCSVRKMNMDRLRMHAIEAAEQSNRLTVPEIQEPQLLRAIIGQYPSSILWADESRENTQSLFETLSQHKVSTILIGPEGGFSEKERDYLREQEKILAIHLGPLILRAETAGIAVLAAVQAIAGAWRER